MSPNDIAGALLVTGIVLAAFTIPVAAYASVQRCSGSPFWKTINQMPPEAYRPGAITRSPHTRDRS